MAVHEIALWAAWHGRMMVVAWAVVLPLGILVARFAKVTPRQRWPEVLDNKLWWNWHQALQYSGIGIMTVATAIALGNVGFHRPMSAHSIIGWIVVLLGWMQILGGIFRGTKGGPQHAHGVASVIRGDHYDMTVRRVLFEYVHKVGGYLSLVLSVVAIVLGMRLVNAPQWMFWTLAAVWTIGALAFVGLQRQGRAFCTYQAIWGPSLEHPGNRRLPVGLGIRRIATSEAKDTVAIDEQHVL